MQKTNSATHPILSQTRNNTTLWIGHLKTDPTDHYAGQTFKSPADGLVDNIQLYSSIVQEPGEVALSLHEFDAASKTWGPSLGDTSMFLEKGDDERWVRFHLQPISLLKNSTYGFRLRTQDAMIGFGEAASPAEQPFAFGHEWSADSGNEKGNYFSYFSLAFKLELCA